MTLKPGDRVYFLDSAGLAIVVEVQGNLVKVYHEGLVIPCQARDLVPEWKAGASGTMPEAAKSDSAEIPVPPTLPKLTTTSRPSETEEMYWENKRRIPKVSGKGEVPIKDKEQVSSKRFPVHKGKKEPDYMEIDLHLEALVEDIRDISPGEAIQIQLHHLFLFMEEVQRKKIRRAFVIHGVGKGKLKEEVVDFLHRYAEAETFDAPFRLYGQGATEIRMHYGGIRPPSDPWRL